MERNVQMSRFLLFAFAVMIVSCGSDSGNDTANPQTAAHNEKVQNLDYNTYEGLLAEEPCDDGMNGVVAHVKEQNTDYVCFCGGNACGWKALNSSSKPNVSSGSMGDIDISSSSVQKSSSSSSSQIQSLAELDGTSCLNEVYGDSPAMEYIAQGMIVPIEGTSTSIKCMRNADGDWVWTVVDNADLIRSSSSNDFVFGEFTDPRDGQVYKTIGIKYSDDIETNGGEEEVWFAEDLRYCPQCEKPPDTSMLYTWQEAMKSECTFGKTCNMSGDVQGLCPEGWLVLPVTSLVIKIGNEVVMEKLVEKGVGYWDTYISNETLNAYPACERRCSVYDCVPYYDPQILTTIYYSEVDELWLGVDWENIHLGDVKLGGDCSSLSESVFQSTRHRLRCYKKEKVPSSQTTVGICWSKYDGYTTQNICDLEKKLGL